MAIPSTTTVDPAAYRAALSAEAVITQDLDAYAVDGVRPGIALRPGSVNEVSAALGVAQRGGHAVIAQGGRTMIGLGNPPSRYHVALDLSALRDIVAYDPDDFTVTALAGTSVAALRLALAERNQFLPLDPPHPTIATLGGMVAVGHGGPRRAAFGTARDWLIGCRVALPEGSIIHGGGRVVKNVSGYDLPRLFAGSMGTLGCIVEVTFKLRPIPPADLTLPLPCRDLPAALAIGARIAAAINGLQAVVALDAATAARAAPAPGHAGATLILRAAGVQTAAGAALAAAAALAGQGRPAPAPTDPAAWEAIADLETAPADPASPLVRLSVPPASLAEALDAVRAAWPAAACHALVDAGLLIAALPALDAAALRRTRATVAALGGFLTVDAAPADAKAALLTEGIDVWGPPLGGLPIMQRIKAAYDPARILAPGRFAGGI